VFADSTGTIRIIEAYKEAKIISNMSFMNYFLIQLGWLLAQGLYWLVVGLETVLLSINKVLGGFFSSPEFVEFLDKFKPMMIGIFAISFGVLGYKFMFKPKINKSKIATNVIMAILVVVGLPLAMNELYKLTDVAVGAISNDELSIAKEILYENVTDVTLYDSMGMPVPPPKLERKSNFSKSKIINIDPIETIDPKNMKMEDVWKNKVKPEKNGQGYLEKTKKEKYGIEFTSTMYYRYKIDFFSIYVTLIISALALVLCGIKIARLLYELAINQSIAFFTAFTDLESGQRLKKCIEMIVGTFVILFSCFFLLQIYVIGSQYCNEHFDNIFARLIGLGALAWAVIDGPNLVERIVGIDAGINSAFRTLTGTYAASKTISAISKGFGGFVKNTASKTGTISSSVAGGVAGGIAGAYSGIKENRSSPGSAPTSASEASNTNTVSSSVSSKSGSSPIANTSSHDNIPQQESHERNSSEPQRRDVQESQNSNQPRSTTQNTTPKQSSANTFGSAIKASVSNTNLAKQYRCSYELTSNSIVQPYQKKIEKIQRSINANDGAGFNSDSSTKKSLKNNQGKDTPPIEMGW
jgi:hypothetical protein